MCGIDVLCQPETTFCVFKLSCEAADNILRAPIMPKPAFGAVRVALNCRFLRILNFPTTHAKLGGKRCAYLPDSVRGVPAK